MALVNCSINSQSLTKTAGAQIGSDNVQLVITPYSGYVVSASDFTDNTGVLTGVSNITLSDSGTPGQIGNTVLVDVDLDDTYVMPGADTNIVIDIDGSAALAQFSLNGNYNISQQNTTSSNGNTVYTATGNYNQTVSVFTKTVTASVNYYFKNLPYYYITSSYKNNYTVTTTNTTDSNGNVTAVTFTVTFLIPNANVSGDIVYIVANASPLTVIQEEIYSYTIATSDIPSNGQIRELQVLGNPNADFDITITTSGGNTYDFSTVSFTSATTSLGASVMPAKGFVSHFINFPPSTSDVYTITLTGDLNLPVTKPNPFTISQYGDIDITVGIDSIDGTLTLSPDQIITTRAGQNNTFTKILSFTVTDTSPIYIGPQPDVLDWVFGALNGSDIEVVSTAITGNGTNSLKIAVELLIVETGTSNVDITLDIDPYFNTPPVAASDFANVTKGSSVTIDVLDNDSDVDSDPLSITIVSNPSNGTVSTNVNNEIVYTHDDSSVMQDSFTYKISDGYNFSNIVTVYIAVGIAAGETLSTTGNEGIYLIPIVLGTTAGTFKSHFNASSIPDRFQILFDTAGTSNDLADMEVVADSLWVGDSVTSTNPTNGTYSNLNEYTYVGANGDATGAGEPGSEWDKTGNANQTIVIADTDVVSDSGSRTDGAPNGPSRNSSGNTQVGVQNLVYTSPTDTVGTSDLDYHDGNICLTYAKSTTTAHIGYIRVFAEDTNTFWAVYKTEFIES
jgi:hypothetical protein